MERYNYDRLSAQDNSFLLAESPHVHMHVSAIQIFEAGPLRNEAGGIDVAAIRHGIGCVYDRIPRYRQKLAWIPFENRPVWVDDPHFNPDYHIRHVSLPRPGSILDLKRVAARVMSHPLDRAKPLWEHWIVEGLEGGRFAIIGKVHHCMLDGASGVDLAQILLSPSPDYELPEPRPFIPRQPPTRLELLRDELQQRAALPLRALRGLASLGRDPETLRREVRTRAQALRELAGMAISRASETPLNGPLGPHRRFDWLTSSLGDVKAVRKALGCTVNDVVLSTVTGAVRQFLLRRQSNPARIVFRVSAPVSVRRDEPHGELGNRVSSWIVTLPVGEPDRLRQLEAIHEETRRLKASRQALGVEMMMTAAEWAPSGIVSLGAQLASGQINSIVTNVPGPQFPLYMLGARLLAIIPQVPLLEGLGLGIALMSYDGKIFWGFTADYDRVPDLADFVELVRGSFQELAAAAGVRPAGLADDPVRADAGTLVK